MANEIVGADGLGQNLASNFNLGSKCAIINECSELGSGSAQGDFKKAALNAGLLGMYSMGLQGAPANSKLKIGINLRGGGVMAAGLASQGSGN